MIDDGWFLNHPWLLVVFADIRTSGGEDLAHFDDVNGRVGLGGVGGGF